MFVLLALFDLPVFFFLFFLVSFFELLIVACRSCAQCFLEDALEILEGLTLFAVDNCKLLLIWVDAWPGGSSTPHIGCNKHAMSCCAVSPSAVDNCRLLLIWVDTWTGGSSTPAGASMMVPFFTTLFGRFLIMFLISSSAAKCAYITSRRLIFLPSDHLSYDNSMVMVSANWASVMSARSRNGFIIPIPWNVCNDTRKMKRFPLRSVPVTRLLSMNPNRLDDLGMSRSLFLLKSIVTLWCSWSRWSLYLAFFPLLPMRSCITSVTEGYSPAPKTCKFSLGMRADIPQSASARANRFISTGTWCCDMVAAYSSFARPILMSFFVMGTHSVGIFTRSWKQHLQE